MGRKINCAENRAKLGKPRGPDSDPGAVIAISSVFPADNPFAHPPCRHGTREQASQRSAQRARQKSLIAQQNGTKHESSGSIWLSRSQERWWDASPQLRSSGAFRAESFSHFRCSRIMATRDPPDGSHARQSAALLSMLSASATQQQGLVLLPLFLASHTDCCRPAATNIISLDMRLCCLSFPFETAVLGAP